ncbi:MAG: type II secretion system F family protein [Magnetococcales bacterium]|nr:type II secretion system F family protein [Magnetococcales bacterium]
MSFFHYKRISKEGKVDGGLIELPFDNPNSAMTYLERDGGTVLFAQPLSDWLGTILHYLVIFVEKPVSREELAEALNNLAVILKAGIPLLGGIKDTVAAHENPTLSKIGGQIVQRIESGSSFSDAAKGFTRIFPDTMLFLIRLGEESGSLDRTIKDAAEHEVRMDKIAKDMKGAMIYPIFMLVAIFGAMIFWIAFVVPPMIGMFAKMQVELPPLTVWLINTAEFLELHGGTMFLAFVSVIVLIVFSVRQFQPVRRMFHLILLKTPVIKLIMVTYNLAFITEYFSLMLRSGVDVMYSLKVLSEALSNEVYKEKMAEVRDHLIQGIPLKEAFERAEIFPGFVVRMIGVGEQSGTLSDQLEYIATEYRQKLAFLVANIGKVIEPIALGIGGGLFVLMAVALFSPLYTLIGSIGGGGSSGGPPPGGL